MVAAVSDSDAGPTSTPEGESEPQPAGLLGIIAAIIGLIAVPAAVMPYLGLVAGPVLGLLALGLGIVGIARPARRRWPAIAGIVLAALALAVSAWWWATFMGLGSSTSRVDLQVQPPPATAPGAPPAARPEAATLPDNGGEAVLEIDDTSTSFDVAACHIDGDERRVALVGDDGALAVSWSHGGGNGILALDVWPADSAARRFLGGATRGSFERGGPLPLTSGPSFELEGSMLATETETVVTVDLRVACG